MLLSEQLFKNAANNYYITCLMEKQSMTLYYYDTVNMNPM